ncbi:MAG: hypothetical protein WCC48_13445, partial [Anaeromyxobacteraceae bacterium]
MAATVMTVAALSAAVPVPVASALALTLRGVRVALGLVLARPALRLGRADSREALDDGYLWHGRRSGRSAPHLVTLAPLRRSRSRRRLPLTMRWRSGLALWLRRLALRVLRAASVRPRTLPMLRLSRWARARLLIPV